MKPPQAIIRGVKHVLVVNHDKFMIDYPQTEMCVDLESRSKSPLSDDPFVIA